MFFLTFKHLLNSALENAHISIKAVFLHVLADALGSVIAIISALLNTYHASLNINTKIVGLIDPFLR